MSTFIKRDFDGKLERSCYNCRWGVQTTDAHKSNGEPFVKCVSESGRITMSAGSKRKVHPITIPAEGYIFDPDNRKTGDTCPGFEWKPALTAEVEKGAV